MILRRGIAYLATFMLYCLPIFSTDNACATNEKNPAETSSGFGKAEIGFGMLNTKPPPQKPESDPKGSTPATSPSAVTAPAFSSLKIDVLRRTREIRAKGACDNPDLIGQFGPAGAIVFDNQQRLAIVLGETEPSQTLVSYKQFHDHLDRTCNNLLPPHYALFGEAISLFGDFEKVMIPCLNGSDKLCVESAFKHLDVSNDQHLSVAEIARAIRGLAFFAIYFMETEQNDQQWVKSDEIYIYTAVSSLLGPTFALNLVSSTDYDNDGLISLDEFLQDRGPHSLAGSLGSIASPATQMTIKAYMGALSSSASLFMGFMK